MPTVRFDQFYRYDSLTQILQAYAAEFPHLVALESLGQSYEGREIWLLRVTCFATGPDPEKPALWVDGNIHSVELAGSSACLYLLQTLIQGYGVHADITRALETRTFYICPRLNPDGAEWALADQPRFIRSSTRPYPYDEEQLIGLRREDIDGDGQILSMRIPDPNGAWKGLSRGASVDDREIELPEEATLIMGKQRQEVGQLERRAYKPTMPSSDPTRDRAKVEWVVQAPEESMVKLAARHDRAGVIRAKVKLK